MSAHPAEETHAAVERVFRSSHGRMMASLVRRFGVEHLPRIENAVQDAGLRALEHWPAGDTPRNPEAWLVQVAHNQFVNTLRRDQRWAALTEEELVEQPPSPEVDDELRLIFLCCHPQLSRAAQVALTLRVGFGFTTPQIARAFLSDEKTIAQRIVRAKRRLREIGARFEIPATDNLPTRLDSITAVLYQLFTEGYSATEDESGIDDALCRESLRLTRLIADDSRLSLPATRALRALLCFQSARSAARRSDDGNLLLLQEQDRSRWDRELIAEGFFWLDRASAGDEFSRFHVEAGIAAVIRPPEPTRTRIGPGLSSSTTSSAHARPRLSSMSIERSLSRCIQEPPPASMNSMPFRSAIS